MSVVVITGCSSGFGEAIALGFARRGARVITSLRRTEDASARLKEAIAPSDIVKLDVTNEASRAEFVRDVLGRHGRIDTLVNNAGMSFYGSIEDTSDELARRIFETNYFGPLALMRAVLPVMRAQQGGRVVNVTAIGVFLPTALLGVYSASKSALDAVSAAADLEGRPFGVRVPSVLPGQFNTAIAHKSPKPVVTEAYAGIAAALDRHRTAHAADFQSDYSQVVDAVIAAATDELPQTRYLAGIGIALRLEKALAEMESIQRFSAERAGLSS
jgi:NAD(P)-dependent dehydrogenase (short-subunit alcohol dehydrogenase family)